MSAHGEGLGYSSSKIFITLFVLTAVEVAWGHFFAESSRALLWGGLLIFAIWKGLLIFMYFMHMKFEKAGSSGALILPTPVLVAVIVLFALMPDVAFNQDIRDHRLGDSSRRRQRRRGHGRGGRAPRSRGRRRDRRGRPLSASMPRRERDPQRPAAPAWLAGVLAGVLASVLVARVHPGAGRGDVERNPVRHRGGGGLRHRLRPARRASA